MSTLGDPTVGNLQVALGRSSRRAAVVASNLANLETPGYRALDVSFEDALEGVRDVELRRAHPGHLSPSGDGQPRGKIVEAPVTRVRNDGNTVDLDREMTLFAFLQGRYRAATEMVRKRFALLVYTATDGKSG